MLRPYRSADDVWAIRRFLQRGWQVAGPACGYYHPGDLSWQRYLHPPDVFVPEERIALWERPDGELAGYAWYYPKSQEFVIGVDVTLIGTQEWTSIAGELLVWAESKCIAGGAKEIGGSLLESDVNFANFLTGHGYQSSPANRMRFHQYDLAGSVPHPALPDGYRIVPMTGDADLEQRVQIHRDVWAPSRFTLESYQAVRAAPGYDPELDLVAVAPDGTYAAYAICWHDEVNLNGEFEPVGAREAFRGRGLARAVLHEGLRRLQQRGCTFGYVYSMDDSEPACRLYLSAGFKIMDYWINLQRSAI